MQTRHLKFLLPFSLFVLAYLAFTQRGWLIASPVIYAFGFIPLLELLIPLSKENMTEAEEKIAKDDRIYDWWLYIIDHLGKVGENCGHGPALRSLWHQCGT